MDSGSKFYSVTDLSCVCGAKFTRGILLNFLIDRRFFVLLCYRHFFCRGIQETEGTKGRVYQIVAKIQIVKNYRLPCCCSGNRGDFCGFLRIFRICFFQLFCFCQSQFGKDCRIRILFPAHISPLPVKTQISRLASQPVFPGWNCFISICFFHRVKAFQYQKLIDLIGLPLHCIIDRDFSGVIIGSAGRKNGHCHGKYHDYRQ